MADDADYVGKVIVVGIAFTGGEGGTRTQQFAGTVDRFQGEGEEEAAVILLCHDGVERAFPWDPEALEAVEPGTYRLNDDGAVIRDPDYIMQFVVDEGEE